MTQRILIVEDDSNLSTLLRLMLRLSNWEIASASNGSEALERAEVFRPTLVLLDVMLPGTLDGIDVCQHLRTEPYMDGVPIVMLSARDDLPTRESARQAGATDYWTKPVIPQEFVGRVKRVLGEG